MSSRTFAYFIAEKGPMLVVSFVGSLSHDFIDKINQCAQEISEKKTIQFVILNFREVKPELDPPVIRPMMQFQAMIRQMEIKLRLIGIHPKLRKLLDAQALIHSDEVFNNVEEAIKSFAKKK